MYRQAMLDDMRHMPGSALEQRIEHLGGDGVMHDVCNPKDLQKKCCILESPSLHLQERLFKVAKKPHLYNRRLSYPNRGRGRGVLLAVETGPPLRMTLECMTAYMLLSMERLNKTWSVRLHATAIHLQRSLL